jgi:hypothetical protein
MTDDMVEMGCIEYPGAHIECSRSNLMMHYVGLAEGVAEASLVS